MKNRNFSALGNALVLLVLVYSICAALKLPIYPDEVAYKIFIERYFYSGGYKQSLTPYCAAGFLVKPPVVLLPASIFGSALTLLGGEWWSYRIPPLLCLVFIFGILIYINHSSINKVPWFMFSIFIITPCLYGLIILRPEVFILLSGLAIYFSGQIIISKENHNFFKLLSLVASIFLYSFVAFIHPKSLYLLPLLLLVVIYGALNFKDTSFRVFFALMFGALCIYISVSALELHKIQYLKCFEVERIEMVMKKQSLNLLELFYDPINFFNAIRSNINLDFLLRAISQFMFKENFDSNYLPPITSGGIILPIINLINILLLTLIMMVVIVFNVVGWKYLPIKKYFLIAFLSAGYLFPYFLNLSKNWYENSFIFGALIILLSIINPYFYINFKKISWLHIRSIQIGLRALVIISIMGSFFMINRYFTPEFNNGYVGPGISIDYKRTTLGHTIMQLIKNNSLNEEIGFISDDLTYEYLKERKLIIPATYLSLVGDMPEVINRTLDNINIRFGITRCITLTYVSPRLNWRILESRTDPASNEAFCLFEARQ